MLGLTSQNRTNFNLLDAGGLNCLNIIFVNEFAFFNNHIAGFRMQNILLSRTPQNSVTDRNNNISTINHRTHDNSSFGTAVHFGNHNILSHINQATCQVTGVSCFQCGISQTFTSTVG